MTPLVSILVPAHNAAAWLGATLDSALAQTHPSCEIIVVDDGSTDGTVEVARARAADGVRVESQPRAGAAAARNRAMRLSAGEFIQYLDADDLISPGKIAAQVSLLADRAPATLATCRWGRFESDPGAARFVDDDVFRDFTPIDYLLLHTRDQRMMHPAAWLVPRPVALRAGAWDERLSLNDDGEYFARVVLASAGIVFTADRDAASYYRSGLPTSLSRRRSPAALASLALSVELVAARLAATEDSPRVRRALADYWQRVAYELYPGAPLASRAALARVAALGGSAVPPPFGPRRQALARVLGWRLVRRLFPS